MSTRSGLLPAGIAWLVFLLFVGTRIASAQIPLFPACDTPPPGLPPLVQYNICEIVIQQTTYVTTTTPPCDLECAKERAYTEPDVKAVFTHQSDGKTRTVHAFYEVDSTSQIVFRVRFNMSEPGNWSYQINCTLQSDPTGNATCPVTGPPKSFTVQAAVQGSNNRGFLRRDAPSRPGRFVYDDNFHPFVWGQTYYQIISNNVSGGGWQLAVRNSRDNGLNKVRMLLYPWWDYAPYGDTQPFIGAMAAPNHNRLNLTHWQKFDEIVNYLYGMNDLEGSRMLAEIILFKDPATGDHNRTFGTEPQDDRYLKYAVARFGAFPNVMWCFSNEWQFTGKDKTYWDNRAVTLLGWDPWMFNGARQRATSTRRTRRRFRSPRAHGPLMTFCR